MKTLATQILDFIKSLTLPFTLPAGIQVMNPFLIKETLAVCESFYNKYYSDNNERHLIIGINPGRFGGGITGIPFTDPIRLQKECGIENSWPKKQELSSVFIYDVIKAYGFPDAFYGKFYFTAVSPLGFTKHNKNLNYYDDKNLQEKIKDFVVDCLEEQLHFGVNREVAYCLGDGKNYTYLSTLNENERFFDRIIPLSHPRFIMQYQLKKKEEYIHHYLNLLK